jgi:large subunit ribosomal protein L7e
MFQEQNTYHINAVYRNTPLPKFFTFSNLHSPDHILRSVYFIPTQNPHLKHSIHRIRGINGIDPKKRKTLQLLLLRQKMNPVFGRLNKATIEMLRQVEPYIAYGYPSAVVVRELILKRGFASVNGQRIPLTCNEIIFAALKQFGIESIEDLAHEIYTCGPNFASANRFLWPFKLNGPVGGFREIRRHYAEGGDYGNREHLIDDLVTRMI